MENNEVIATLAKQLLIEKATNKVLGDAILEARQYFICIGGPLNDNKHGFTKEQIVYLDKIYSTLQVIE